MAKKTKKRQREEREWWRRRPWPVVMLAVDPGNVAGAATFVAGELVNLDAVDLYSRDIEVIVERAGALATFHRLPFVLCLEAWGRGGDLGIDQWIGLGEARGAWRRAFAIYCNEHDDREGRIALFSKARAFNIGMQTWRSWAVPETGFNHPVMGWRPFKPDEWKEAAARALASHFPNIAIPSSDAAEAGCIGIYASRSDEVGSKLPSTFLASHGLAFPPAPPGPRVRRRA